MDDLIETIRDTFPRKRIAVIGDIVADQFLSGTITRVSREAPVFILRHDETQTRPGAAGNAAANVASLGAEPILISLVGGDANGMALLESLTGAGVSTEHMVVDRARATVTKQRVLAGQQYGGRQQVIRVDFENSEEPSEDVRTHLAESFRRIAGDVDAYIISDYGYDVVSAELFNEVRETATTHQVPLVIDSRHKLARYAGATTATPNREELEELLDGYFDGQACEDLRQRLRFEALMVTDGNKGITLFDGADPLQMPAIGALEPIDVTGAGDTVIAAYSLALASGLGFRKSAMVSNHAGGIVVMKRGTATVSADELIASVSRDSAMTAAKGVADD